MNLNIEGTNVRWAENNPNTPIARRASSHLILQSAMDEASRLEPPPMFKKSLLYMDDFNHKNMGAKSNNLKQLRDKLDAGIKVPESATIPFKMQEYSIDLEPTVKAKIEQITNLVTKVKSVRKMNQMLHQCKELVLGLKFHESD